MTIDIGSLWQCAKCGVRVGREDRCRECFPDEETSPADTVSSKSDADFFAEMNMLVAKQRRSDFRRGVEAAIEWLRKDGRQYQYLDAMARDMARELLGEEAAK